MKKLIKLTIPIFIIAALLSSCKNNWDLVDASTAVTTGMEFSANGKKVNFNQCVAGAAVVNGVNQILILGDSVINGNVGNASFEVNILQTLSALKAGQTYPIATSFSQSLNGSNLFYYPTGTTFFVTQPANPVGTVTITYVTATYIRGTFSGQLFSSLDFSGTSPLYTITGGGFTAAVN